MSDEYENLKLDDKVALLIQKIADLEARIAVLEAK